MYKRLIVLASMMAAFVVTACSNTAQTAVVNEPTHSLPDSNGLIERDDMSSATRVANHLEEKLSNVVIPVSWSEEKPRFGSNADNAKRPLSIVEGHDTGGQLQERIKSGGQWSGFEAGFYVYTDGSVHMTAPSPSPTQPSWKFNELFAPTAHTSGSCFEIGNQYQRNPGQAQTVPALFVFDFCNGSVGVYSYYTYAVGHIDPAIYSTQTSQPHEFTVSVTRQANGTWLAIIFNYHTGYWDVLKTSIRDSSQIVSGGNAGLGNDGWDMFETHFNKGVCPAIPMLGSSLMALLSTPTPTPYPTPIPSGDPTPTAVPTPVTTTAAYPFQGILMHPPASPDIQYYTVQKPFGTDCTGNNSPGSGVYYQFSAETPQLWFVSDVKS